MAIRGRLSTDDFTAGPVVAVVAVGALGAAALLLRLPLAVSLGALAAGTAAAAALLARPARRRALAIRRLEQAARRLVTTAVEDPEGAGEVFHHEMGGRDQVPEDLAPLHRAIDDLGTRIERHWKDVLKKSRNLQALIEVMDEPLLATDDAERILLCNRSAEAILNAGPGELIGRPISEVFTQAELLEMHAAARANQTRREKLRVMTPLGQRTFQVSATPVPAAWGEGVFGAVMILRDVTELDQAAQVKTDFVANASHELRTPVAAIRGAAETLQSAGDDPEMAERLRQMIVNHALRLEEMLRDLLDLSRLESPDAPLQIDRIDLEEVDRTLAGLFEEVCRERRLELRTEFDADLSGMRTDPKLLMLILRNLVENATKFAFEGTAVRVSGTLVEAEVPRVAGAPGAAATRGVARFEVADRGVGIPLALQDRVFERYYQADPARSGGVRRGTGLGLAIVKHAAKRLGGRAGLSSLWGRGTTAFVEIPVSFGAGGASAGGPSRLVS